MAGRRDDLLRSLGFDFLKPKPQTKQITDPRELHRLAMQLATPKKSFVTAAPAPVATVEEIHEAFETASDSALREANEILGRPVNQHEYDDAVALQKCGFLQSETSIQYLNEIRVREKHQERINKIEHWRVKYPNHKFIFLDQVKAICEKYGLVLGFAHLFKGKIPKKNVDEIVSFSLKEEDQMYLNWQYGSRDRWRIYAITKQPKYSYINSGSLQYTGDNAKCGFMICAPSSEMNMEGQEVIGSVVSAVVKDPIVLMPVEERGEGFLIVSKWGPEASDPALVNETGN